MGTERGAIRCDGRTITAVVIGLAVACGGSAQAELAGTDAVDALADLIGSDPLVCASLIVEVTGSDPSTLLEGLTPGEATELLELIADLSGDSINAEAAHAAVGWATGEMRDTARLMEEYIPDHLYYGASITGVVYPTADWELGTVVSKDSLAHSAIWAGHYLASVSFRYALAKKHRDTTKNYGQSVVWQKEMDRALARVHEMVPAFHRLINISKNWSSATVPGEPGLLFRHAVPEQFNRSDTWPLPWDDGQIYWCRASVTRDIYAGVMLGLMVTFDQVGPDDAYVRNTIRDDVMILTDYLVRHGWWVVQPQSSTTNSNPSPNPLFVLNPAHRLSMAQAARHVARVAGTAADQAKWEAVWAAELAEVGAPHLLTSRASTSNDSYYSNNLEYLCHYNVVSREPNRATRAFLLQAFAQLDDGARLHMNAHFDAMAYGLRGQPDRLPEGVLHLKQWIEYRSRWGQPVVNSARCGVDIQCSGGYAVDPLPIPDRPHSDFLWQRSPWKLDGGYNPLQREPGVDFLLPYYMLRYYTEVAPPTP
ncbi:MAG: hypothetical protein HY706_19050 [Candidatus Hydrogenedentes bacterium]|nr:hypothetical protein [Candidatus Hydrogenedentota bacterium]